jgi:hypothetical protein
MINGKMQAKTHEWQFNWDDNNSFESAPNNPNSNLENGPA